MIPLNRCISHQIAVALGLLFGQWTGSVAIALAADPAPAPQTPGSSANDPPGLVAEHIYNGINRPCIVIVTSPRSIGTVSLVLMDNDGNALAPAAEVHPGRVDLADAFPTILGDKAAGSVIWSLERAAFLQMLDHDQPVGPSLVLQPMFTRMVPQTQVTRRASGSLYSKIIGWVEENHLPPLTLPAPPATAPATGTAPPASQPAPPATDTPPAKPLCSGLRIWPDADVILHTTKGDIRIGLRPDQAPNTAWNFLELSRGGFYRDITFHRIVPFTANGDPFVIQAGDPTATGDGGPGFWLPIEDSHLPHDFGVISMARNDDPDSNGSQFFICLSREGTARLDGQYCSFGYAVTGAKVIKAIASVELANVAEGRAVNPPVIKDAELIPAPPRIPGRGRPDERVSSEQVVPLETRPHRVPR
jgi:cyclophilin family peptidyl-prolyl cis-trans isomerase